MKYLILTLVLFSTQLQAENWLNHSKIKSGSIEAYSLKSDCERVSGEVCFDLGNYPVTVYSEVDVQVDDNTKPNYSKSEVETCTTNANCQTKLVAKTCTDLEESPIKNLDLKEVYCSKFTGYDQKTAQTIVLDQTKLSAYQAQLAINQAMAQKEAGIQGALNRIDCGKRVIALMVIRNVTKALSTAQISQMNTVYAPIKGLLETASLVTAKEFILATTADGVLITSSDLAALAAETQKCIDL